MEDDNTIKISELCKKFRTRRDRVNFCRENGLYLPEFPGYDMKFFLQVLQGKKKLLNLGGIGGYDFSYFTKDHKFTKKHLWSFFEKDKELMRFIPDDISEKSLNRKFLFAVLAINKQDIYLKLYSEYKNIIANQNTTKWNCYGIQLANEMKSKVDSFLGSGAPTREKPFRLTKNGEKIEEIKRIDGNDDDLDE